MKVRKRIEWTRLENASKYFPATANDKDTKVFRFSCELYEAAEPEILQQAIDRAIDSFPIYKSVLKRGIFWYYLEGSDIRPVVEIESTPVCAPIYRKDSKNLLFRVFYYNNRINLEIFHALSDGTGALWFVQTVVYHYLSIKYKSTLADKVPELYYNAPISEKGADSFGRYFSGESLLTRNTVDDTDKEAKTAYHIQGNTLDEYRTNLIEGSMSVKAVLNIAHEYDTTLTVFLTSLFMYSIYKGMPTRAKNRPVVLSVPINLRQFYESETARNFFSTMNASYRFEKDSTDFKEVVESVRESFKRGLTEERLSKQLNRLMTLEKNPAARVMPLPLKDFVIRIANKLVDRRMTGAISNIGRISLPPELSPYVRQFSICTSVRRPQACICSYGDRLVVSFTSPFRETDIQRTFFEFLSKKGIEIEISSNL